MFELLYKTFIPDRNNVKDASVRQRYGVFGGTVGICLNIVLFTLKLFAGLIANSIGVIADALNNLSDAGSSIITLIGFKLSGKPADHDHPFGHGRVEYVSALLVSIAIILMGFELGKTSIEKIITPQDFEFSTISVVILFIAIAVKLWMYFFNSNIGKKISSQSMKATAMDSLSDTIATSTVLIGVFVSYIFNINVDGYTGLIVSCFILYTGYSTIKDSISPLLGLAPDAELVEQIKNIVMSHEDIIGIHDLIIHNYGPTRFMMSVHAEIPADRDIVKIHDKIDLIEKELSSRFGCDAVIHIDPIEVDNTVISDAKQHVSDLVKEIDERITIHDFRMVTGDTHTNVIFDAVLPFNMKNSDAEIVEMIKNKISEYNSTYFAVVTIDKLYN